MRFLLDTHILLWAAVRPELLSARAARVLAESGHLFFFSPINIWEVAIKSAQQNTNLLINAESLRLQVVAAGFIELPVTASHAAAIARLPPIHKDPFDRMLVAQATVEDLILLTADTTLVRYPGPIELV